MLICIVILKEAHGAWCVVFSKGVWPWNTFFPDHHFSRLVFHGTHFGKCCLTTLSLTLGNCTLIQIPLSRFLYPYVKTLLSNNNRFSRRRDVQSSVVCCQAVWPHLSQVLQDSLSVIKVVFSLPSLGILRLSICSKLRQNFFFILSPLKPQQDPLSWGSSRHILKTTALS